MTIVIFRQQLKGSQIFTNKLYTRELDILVTSVIIRQKDENFLKRINNLYMKVFDGLVNSANIKQHPSKVYTDTNKLLTSESDIPAISVNTRLLGRSIWQDNTVQTLIV